MQGLVRLAVTMRFYGVKTNSIRMQKVQKSDEPAKLIALTSNPIIWDANQMWLTFSRPLLP